MKNYIYTLCLLLGFTFLNACKKNENAVPEVETVEAKPTSSFSCLFKGSIAQTGKGTVTDYGFLYGRSV
jgi:hypothetical protein